MYKDQVPRMLNHLFPKTCILTALCLLDGLTGYFQHFILIQTKIPGNFSCLYKNQLQMVSLYSYIYKTFVWTQHIQVWIECIISVRLHSLRESVLAAHPLLHYPTLDRLHGSTICFIVQLSHVLFSTTIKRGRVGEVQAQKSQKQDLVTWKVNNERNSKS